jgi:hypothetical protein
MTMPKFSLGDRVRPISSSLNMNVRQGVYEIVRVMPVTSQGCQYRAKNALDSHERVFEEVQIVEA